MSPILLAQAKPPPVILFTELDSSLQTLFTAFLEPSVNNLTGALQGVALLGVTLYLLFLGVTILLGAESTPIYTMLRTLTKIAFVAGISLSASGYQSVVVGTLKGLESGLVSTMQAVKAAGATESTDSPENIARFLDQTMGVGFDRAKVCFELGIDKGILSPGSALAWIFLGLIFGLSTAGLVVVGGAMVILAQFATTILFALGPLFVMCLMFPQTESFFYKWLGEVLSFVFQTVIIAAVLSFALVQFTSFAEGAKLQEDDILSPLYAALQVFVVAFVMVYLLIKAGPMGASLSGGMSASHVSPQGALQTAGALLSGGAKAASMVGKAASVPGRIDSAFQRANRLGGRNPGGPIPNGLPSRGPSSPGMGSNVVIAVSNGSPSGGSQATKNAAASFPGKAPISPQKPRPPQKNATRGAAQEKAIARFAARSSSSASSDSANTPSKALVVAPNQAKAPVVAGQSEAPTGSKAAPSASPKAPSPAASRPTKNAVPAAAKSKPKK